MINSYYIELNKQIYVVKKNGDNVTLYLIGTNDSIVTISEKVVKMYLDKELARLVGPDEVAKHIIKNK